MPGCVVHFGKAVLVGRRKAKICGRVTLVMGSALIMLLGSLPVVSAFSAGRQVTCQSRRATIVGTNAGETIQGTRGRDVIAARGGSDAILGKGGKDLICAGAGADLVDGQRGLDAVYGGRGEDGCFGEQREHRKHHGCEAHLPPSQSEPAPPPAPKAAEGLQPSDRGSVRGGAASHHLLVDCSSDGVDLQTVSSGAYTDPAFIAVRPVFFGWTTAGWTFAGYGQWTTLEQPLESVATTSIGHYSLSNADYWLIESQWLWWDGAAWTSYAYAHTNVYDGVDELGIRFCIVS